PPPEATEAASPSAVMCCRKRWRLADLSITDLLHLVTHYENMNATALKELQRLKWSVGETPQPAATGANSMAGMGHCREATPSNSSPLAALHSGLEQAHEPRGGP